MPEDREHIPNELQRQLMLEVGYRCPLCHQNEPLVFEHIEEYADVQKHEFTNMIVLCASCHGRKKDTSNPRHINKSSLKKLKQNLMLLNGRYSDLERRFLEASAVFVRHDIHVPRWVLSDTLQLMMMRLRDDGLVTIEHREIDPVTSWSDGVEYKPGVILVELTEAGREFVRNLISVTAV
jgi:HNH endonuclease